MPAAPDHGTRCRYKQGCKCVLCRAAEAVYRRAYRLDKAKGKPRLGQLISATEARRRIRQLQLEGYPKARIAAMAGWKNRHVQFTDHARITIATHLRVRRLAQFAMLEGVDELPGDGGLKETQG